MAVLPLVSLSPACSNMAGVALVTTLLLAVDLTVLFLCSHLLDAEYCI